MGISTPCVEYYGVSLLLFKSFDGMSRAKQPVGFVFTPTGYQRPCHWYLGVLRDQRRSHRASWVDNPIALETKSEVRVPMHLRGEINTANPARARSYRIVDSWV
jgi:hypothetical protein